MTFMSIEFNTKEKMMQCFRKLKESGREYCYTFYLASPPELAKRTKYMVCYLPIKEIAYG